MVAHTHPLYGPIQPLCPGPRPGTVLCRLPGSGLVLAWALEVTAGPASPSPETRRSDNRPSLKTSPGTFGTIPTKTTTPKMNSYFRTPIWLCVLQVIVLVGMGVAAIGRLLGWW